MSCGRGNEWERSVKVHSGYFSVVCCCFFLSYRHTRLCPRVHPARRGSEFQAGVEGGTREAACNIKAREGGDGEEGGSKNPKTFCGKRRGERQREEEEEEVEEREGVPGGATGEKV